MRQRLDLCWLCGQLACEDGGFSAVVPQAWLLVIMAVT